jgi:uncharacterized protein YcfJ
MKKDFKVNPIGLKGNEINERMRQLMGIATINENTSRSVVELTKMGPDGKAYAIVRENHEYFIKVSDKTSKLVTEDFKYIGGLQNKKQEAYPSYAKATKHLNLTFKSLAEAYGTDSNINVFEDDDLLNEENFATKHIVDKNGTPLKQDAKEGSEEDGFGDNVATGKTDKEFEKVKKMNEGVGGFSEMKGSGFSGAGNLEENDPMWEDEMTDEEKAIDEMIAASKADECWMGEEQNVDYTMGSKDPNQLPNPAPELHIPVDENWMEEDMDESYMEEDDNVDYTMGRNDSNQLPNPPSELHIPVDEDMEDNPRQIQKQALGGAKTPDQYWDALGGEDLNIWDVAGDMAKRLGVGTATLLKLVAGALGGEDVRNHLNNRNEGMGCLLYTSDAADDCMPV